MVWLCSLLRECFASSSFLCTSSSVGLHLHRLHHLFCSLTKYKKEEEEDLMGINVFWQGRKKIMRKVQQKKKTQLTSTWKCRCRFNYVSRLVSLSGWLQRSACVVEFEWKNVNHPCIHVKNISWRPVTSNSRCRRRSSRGILEGCSDFWHLDIENSPIFFPNDVQESLMIALGGSFSDVTSPRSAAVTSRPSTTRKRIWRREWNALILMSVWNLSTMLYPYSSNRWCCQQERCAAW